MKERKKDLFWLIPMILSVALTVYYGWYQKYRPTSEVLLIHRDDISFMTASPEHEGSLTTGGLKNVVIKDENGQKISYEELNAGDYIPITTDNYILLTYPMQYAHVYKIQKTGETDVEFAESIYEQYKKDFTF